MINKVILIGYLGRDPECRVTESGLAVANFSMATSDAYKDKNTGEWIENTEWSRIVAWRHLAERVQSMCQKGTLVYVEGKKKTEKWQDKEGNDRYSTDIVANVLRVLARGIDRPREDAPPPRAQQEDSLPTQKTGDEKLDALVDMMKPPEGQQAEKPAADEDDLPF